MKSRYEIDYEGLKAYLEATSRDQIETTWQNPENPRLVEGSTAYANEYFGKNKKPEIGYGEPFLVDALGNDLSIVILTRRRYRLPTGRVIGGKFDRTIIPDCRAHYGNPLNGQWKIPSQFLKPIKR